MARTLTNEIIDAAIEGFEAQKRRIDDQIAELRSMRNGGSSPAPTPATTARQKRKLSPEAIRRIREGQQRRWAKVRGEAPTAASTSKSAKKKRRLSPEGRKAIQEALRQRWAQKRAAAGAPKPVTKKAAPRKAAKAAKRPVPKKAAPKSAPAASAQPAGE